MSDTIELLKECDAGIKMGTEAIDEVVEQVQNPEFKSKLKNYKDDYNFLQKEIEDMLKNFNSEGKEPNIMAKMMSVIKTKIKLFFKKSDATIADLMTAGCNMGTKSLNKYLNTYENASDEAKTLAKKLIRLMDNQQFDVRKYL